MYKKILAIALITTMVVTFLSCATNTDNKKTQNHPKQLNISILLDLSNRISTKYPGQADKDLKVIEEIINYFKTDMTNRGAYDANGRLQVYMKPAPNISDINSLQSKLIVDCSSMNVQMKKAVYDNIITDFRETLQQIYTATNQQEEWPGSDIWRFFQNDVKDYCIEQDTNYRNILVILTDGYIYDVNTTEQYGNRVQNLTISKFAKYTNVSDPIRAMDKDDFGLIAPCNDLNNLEVLVLEIAPQNDNQKHEQILKYCIEKWLKEMGVAKYAVYKTDLPVNTAKRINLFMKQ